MPLSRSLAHAYFAPTNLIINQFKLSPIRSLDTLELLNRTRLPFFIQQLIFLLLSFLFIPLILKLLDQLLFYLQ